MITIIVRVKNKVRIIAAAIPAAVLIVKMTVVNIIKDIISIFNCSSNNNNNNIQVMRTTKIARKQEIKNCSMVLARNNTFHISVMYITHCTPLAQVLFHTICSNCVDLLKCTYYEMHSSDVHSDHIIEKQLMIIMVMIPPLRQYTKVKHLTSISIALISLIQDLFRVQTELMYLFRLQDVQCQGMANQIMTPDRKRVNSTLSKLYKNEVRLLKAKVTYLPHLLTIVHLTLAESATRRHVLHKIKCHLTKRCNRATGLYKCVLCVLVALILLLLLLLLLPTLHQYRQQKFIICERVQSLLCVMLTVLVTIKISKRRCKWV